MKIAEQRVLSVENREYVDEMLDLRAPKAF